MARAGEIVAFDVETKAAMLRNKEEPECAIPGAEVSKAIFGMSPGEYKQCANDNGAARF